MPLLGAHMSTAGGLSRAFERINEVAGEAMQVFTKNQRQWKASPLKPEEVAQFIQAQQTGKAMPIASHDSYLINLAAPSDEICQKSIDAFGDELIRAATLQIPFLVTHPGAHVGEGVAAGLKRFVFNLDQAITKAAVTNVEILIETTAGQGSSLGAQFSDIAAILERSKYVRQLGVCFDTCHVFAAGYDLRDEDSYHQTMSEFDSLIGLPRLRFFHLNDSKKELGSKVDRHEHIGKGKLGLKAFELLLNDPRFKDIPMVLETPKDDGLENDRENLKVLRSLIKKK